MFALADEPAGRFKSILYAPRNDRAIVATPATLRGIHWRFFCGLAATALDTIGSRPVAAMFDGVVWEKSGHGLHQGFFGAAIVNLSQYSGDGFRHGAAIRFLAGFGGSYELSGREFLLDDFSQALPISFAAVLQEKGAVAANNVSNTALGSMPQVAGMILRVSAKIFGPLRV